MLEVLMAAGGRVVSAEELQERVWDAHADPFSNTVRVTLANLRRKLGDPPRDHHRHRRRLPVGDGHDPLAPPHRAPAADAHLHGPVRRHRRRAARVSYVLVQHREKGPDTAVPVICGKTVSGQNVTRVGGIGPPSRQHGILALNPAQCPNLVGSVYYRSSGAGPGGSVSGTVPGRRCRHRSRRPRRPRCSRLTAAVSASQSHTLDSFKIESAIALGHHHHRVVRAVMVDGRPGPGPRPPHH